MVPRTRSSLHSRKSIRVIEAVATMEHILRAAGVGPKSSRTYAAALVNDHDVASEAMLKVIMEEEGELERLLKSVGMSVLETRLLMQKLTM